jgi:GntR family transcriptional regulator
MDASGLFVVQSILRLWLVVARLMDPITVVTPLSASSPVSDVHAPEVPQGVGVSAPSFSPLYQQIKGLILRGCKQASGGPARPSPARFDLAARYKVSQGTVRKAIDELAAENLLMRRQGKGTFVSTHAEERVQYRFLRLTPDLPIQQEPSQREFLDCRRLKAPADVAKVLNLPSAAT